MVFLKPVLAIAASLLLTGTANAHLRPSAAPPATSAPVDPDCVIPGGQAPPLGPAEALNATLRNGAPAPAPAAGNAFLSPSPGVGID